MIAWILSTLRGLSLIAIWCMLAYGAYRDYQEGTFPNELAVALAGACAVHTVVTRSIFSLLWYALAAVIAFAALYVFELVWRRGHGGSPGIGMGDAKCLAALMLRGPLTALIGFAVALIGLGVAGKALDRSALPLLPFFVPAYALVWLVLG